MNYCDEKLKELNITLPEAPKGVGNYASWIRSGNIIYTSGQLPWKDGKYGTLAYTGKVGEDLNIEQGYDCAKICAINAIAQLKDAVKNLDNIKRIIRIDGHIQAAENFEKHSDVLNGASDIFNHVFGEKGLHTRSALGLYKTPLNAPVLIYVIAEVLEGA